MGLANITFQVVKKAPVNGAFFCFQINSEILFD